MIYYRWHQNEPWYQEYFRWVILDLYNNWIDYGFADVNNNKNDRMYSTPTTDGKTHTAFYFRQLGEGEYSDIGIWRSNMVEDRPTDLIYDYGSILPEEVHYINLSSAANEVHVIWKDDYGNNNGNNLRYKYDDQVPLAPQNLTSYLEPDPSCNNCHGSGPGIRLDWNKNNEPDLSHYIIYRAEEEGNCNDCHQSSNSNPEDSLSNPDPLNETITLEQDCPALSGEITDFTTSKVEVETGCQSGLESTQKLDFEAIWAWPQNWWMDQNIQEDYTYIYYVTAVDATEHESSESNFTLTYVPQGLSKGLVPFSGAVVPKIFFLYQNHPNPFNPVTTIRYQVPKETSVRIEIFNVLGQKVRTLVNEFKAEGYYSVEWNGKNDFEQPLPSGIYLYKMTAGSFSETKKMLLLK